MAERAFRFGVVATPQQGMEQWRATARRAEELGYATLLMPDNLHQITPGTALTVAAEATTALRVATFVLASPLRTPRQAAWEGHSLTVVTGGRFEFGIGTGLPQMRESAKLLNLPYGSGAQRLAEVGTAIDELRELDGASHTPVMLAAGGPKSRALAAEKADIITLAGAALTPRADFAAHVAEVRERAGARIEGIELAMNIFVVGDEVPPWIQQFIGADGPTLIENDSLTMLRGSTREMADELRRRRDELGVSYISVNSAFIEEFAPLVELLHGN